VNFFTPHHHLADGRREIPQLTVLRPNACGCVFRQFCRRDSRRRLRAIAGFDAQTRAIGSIEFTTSPDDLRHRIAFLLTLTLRIPVGLVMFGAIVKLLLKVI